MSVEQKVIALRDYCHQRNNRPWNYGPQNLLLPVKLEDALLGHKLSEGVICGTLARWFVWKLKEGGITGRVVSFKGKGEKHLIHAAVEVETPGGVQLHDPYFNCCFASGARILSGAEVRKCLSRGKPPMTKFHKCSLNWLNAWRAWQKMLEWITEQVLKADDYQFQAGEKVFWEFLLPWVKSGSPTKMYGWKRRQYSYWEYFS